MFSPAKAITAAALAIGIGGVLMIAQPDGSRHGSTPGAVQESVAPPVAFSGTGRCGPGAGAGTSERVELPTADGALVKVEQRGTSWHPTAQYSDPRLDGTVTWTDNVDRYELEGSTDAIETVRNTYRIENEAGAWQASWLEYGQDPGAWVTTTLAGEGAYEGLNAIWQLRFTSACDVEFQGLIVDGDLPPEAEPNVVE